MVLQQAKLFKMVCKMFVVQDDPFLVIQASQSWMNEGSFRTTFKIAEEVI